MEKLSSPSSFLINTDIDYQEAMDQILVLMNKEKANYQTKNR